jgi:hypothetical protein
MPLDVATVVTTKRSRRSAGEFAQAATEVSPKHPVSTTGQRNQAQRAMRNVTSP